MRFSLFIILAAVLVTCPVNVIATSYSASSSIPTTSPTSSNTCVTITQTTGITCPTTLKDCAQPECIVEKTITLECGCPSIYTSTSCPTACNLGCFTAYDTIYIPCAESVPSTTSASTSESSKSVSSSISSSNIFSTTSVIATVTTTTVVVTYTSSTGFNGTVTTTTQSGQTGPTPTTTASTPPPSSPTPTLVNEGGRFGVVEVGVFAGLIAAVLGML